MSWPDWIEEMYDNYEESNIEIKDEEDYEWKFVDYDEEDYLENN